MATQFGAMTEIDEERRKSVEIQDLARFAVDEYNKKENALMELSSVVKAEEQMVAGTLYYLTLEVTDRGEKKLCKAKVCTKEWLHFKELEAFEFVGYQ